MTPSEDGELRSRFAPALREFELQHPELKRLGSAVRVYHHPAGQLKNAYWPYAGSMSTWQ